MKKSKTMRARRPTMAMRLADAEDRVQRRIDECRSLQQGIDAHKRKEDNLTNENTRLSKIIEGLKEELFNKSLALARAEGTLERVDHEDAERAEVVVVEDMQLTRIDHRSGAEISGGPVPFKRTMLKCDLARPPLREVTSGLAYSGAETGRWNSETERPKHWVNRH